ncbi:MAG: phosphoenolpyruvate carboxykinase (ATP) [Candidatus Malihini olakiniferum]
MAFVDSKHQWIGDTEHSWNDNGMFNFEGDYCAKTITIFKTSSNYFI